MRGEWKPHLVRIVDRELAIFVSEGDEAPLKKVPPQHLKPPTPQTLNPNLTPWGINFKYKLIVFWMIKNIALYSSAEI